MNEDGTPIEQVDADAGVTKEGTPPAEPTSDDVQSMYDELGIKAKAPTAKGRPKSSDVRDKDAPKKGANDSDAGKQKGSEDKDKSKDAPAPTGDGDAGDDADKATPKDGGKDGKVPEKSEEADGGVRKDKPAGEGDSERDGEGSSEQGADGAGQEEHDKDAAPKEGEDAEEEGKRPGKSNPEVEKRFQKLTSESKAKDDRIAELEQQLQEKQQAEFKAKIDQEDPEYTVEDFKKVRDAEGNILDLDENEAELAYRRWKDGYEQRKAERDAKLNREQAMEQYKTEASEKLMRSSVAAYDALVDIYENTPELNSNDPKFDKEFSDLVMPIIEEAVIYQPGTEPGNEKGYQPVIVGMKMSPAKIIQAMNTIRQTKRSLPLNGTTDTVEDTPDKSVSHGRSSDPTVHAANQLYQELGIKKRL